MLKRNRAILCFFVSLAIVALGQPARIGWLGALSAMFGFTLFLGSLSESISKRQRFFLGTLWFSAIQLIQLSWMTSIEFQGYYILLVYLLLALGVGCQFGLLTSFIPNKGQIPFSKLLYFASLWAMMEWGRLFFICGFTWNPVGLSLTHNIYSLQFASVFGIYGLSFWVILTNLTALNVWRGLQGSGVKQWLVARFTFTGSFRPAARRPSAVFFSSEIAGAIPSSKTTASAAFRLAEILPVKVNLAWLVVASIPYLFGVVQLAIHNPRSKIESGKINAVLVQTERLPSEKSPHVGRIGDYISPFIQWNWIIKKLNDKAKGDWEIIVLPEAAVPFQSDATLFPFEIVKEMLVGEFGFGIEKQFPPLQFPFAEKRFIQGTLTLCVSNLFWCQTLSNHLNAEMVIGLDHEDRSSKKNFNSAFCFQPQNDRIERYDKQVLLPLAEYLPFSFLKPLANRYGISEFFTPGKGGKVFGKKNLFSPSICYEETFPGVMREGRKKGARLFVNVTNDNYYPNSSLHNQHLFHARVRAVENGIPLIRSCNSGISAAIDSFGRIVARMDGEKDLLIRNGGILNCHLSAYTFLTLYTFWGDALIIGLSCALCVYQILILRSNRNPGAITS